MATSPTGSQKDIVRSFLDLVVAGKVDEGYEKFVHPEFKHHNVWFKGDRQTLLDGMKESHTRFPTKKFEVRKIMEEGDTVVTYSYISLDGMQAMSVVHICRLKDGKIIEMWDLGQEIPADSPNKNGAF